MHLNCANRIAGPTAVGLGRMSSIYIVYVRLATDAGNDGSHCGDDTLWIQQLS
jgi:hypothetical protein